MQFSPFFDTLMFFLCVFVNYLHQHTHICEYVGAVNGCVYGFLMSVYMCVSLCVGVSERTYVCVPVHEMNLYPHIISPIRKHLHKHNFMCVFINSTVFLPLYIFPLLSNANLHTYTQSPHVHTHINAHK